MSVTLHTQAVIDVDESKAYLQDQGAPAMGDDVLKHHINGITALMLRVMGRDVIIVPSEDIEEYHRGDATTNMHTKNAPITTLTSVTLNPMHTSMAEVITGPGTDLSNDDMYYDPSSGLIVLKNRTTPEGMRSIKVLYKAGFAADSTELHGLKMIALDVLAIKWQRWKNKRHGVASETKQDKTITYTRDDFQKGTLRELKSYSRNLLV